MVDKMLTAEDAKKIADENRVINVLRPIFNFIKAAALDGNYYVLWNEPLQHVAVAKLRELGYLVKTHPNGIGSGWKIIWDCGNYDL